MQLIGQQAISVEWKDGKGGHAADLSKNQWNSPIFFIIYVVFISGDVDKSTSNSKCNKRGTVQKAIFKIIINLNTCKLLKETINIHDGSRKF